MPVLKNEDGLEINAEGQSFGNLQLPFAKIKKIIKLNLDIELASGDAVYVMGKATELFIAHLCKAFYSAVNKSSLTKKQLDDYCRNEKWTEFLDDI
ncbi:unnamed protein product [Gordionus sp. m RMFG-2023]